MPAPGTVWAGNSWNVDAWAANTWADAGEPAAPAVVASGAVFMSRARRRRERLRAAVLAFVGWLVPLRRVAA